ncbi:hypothetical protein ACWGPT_02545 [Pseudorhizobium sp. NPDC055634]
MSRVNAFIAELVKAANDTGSDTRFKKGQLLERAIITICELREEAGIPRTKKADEAIAYLQAVEIAISQKSEDDQLVRKALLLAAGMIRDLHIILNNH